MSMKTKKKDTYHYLITEHGSVVFLGTMLILGGILMVIGIWLNQQTSSIFMYLGLAMLQFSGALIAVALTAFFFNLPDLRNYLAKTIATLFSRGDVVPLLSDNTKNNLRKRLAMDSAGASVEQIEPTLFKHIMDINKASLSSPYVSNYHLAITITADSDHKGYVFNHHVASFRLHVHHLNVQEMVFPVRFFQECVFPKDDTPEMDQWIRSFHAEIGAKNFNSTDLETKEKPSGDNILFQLVLHSEVTISEDIDVCFTSELWGFQNDPVQMVFARYPSQGFHVSLTFTDEFKYYCGWFIHCDPLTDIPTRGRVDSLKNGISVRTNDWVLPGEGVIIYYYKPL